MRSEKITKHSLTLMQLGSLLKRLHIRMICLIVIFGLNTACAPQAWLQEAQTYSHLGQWEKALGRYEDSLSSGIYWSAQLKTEPIQVRQGSELVVEALFEDYKKQLNDTINVISTVNTEKKQDICRLFTQLESLYPLSDELAGLQAKWRSNELKPQDFAAFLSEYDDLAMTNTQQANDHAILHKQRARKAKLLQQVFLKSEKAVHALMRQEEVFSYCSPLELDWYQVYQSYEDLYRQLDLLILVASEVTHEGFDYNSNGSKLSLHHIKRLYYLIQNLMAQELSLSQFFEDEMLALQNNLRSSYTNTLDLYVEQSITSEKWGMAWWLKQLFFVPEFLSSDMHHPLLSYLPFIDDELSRQQAILEKVDYQVQDNKLQELKAVDQSKLNPDYTKLYPTQPVTLTVNKGQVHCDLSTQKQSHELRKVAETKQVTAPQYLAALKRVEALQSRLESALSQREHLEKSILKAQADLELLDQDQLKELEEAFQKLKQESAVLKQGLEMTQAQIHKAFNMMGPLSEDELAHLKHLKVEVTTLKKQLELKDMNVEIAKSAWEESVDRLQQRRREVNRLAGYLTKTVIELEQTTAELDQKEVDLALIPKSKNEKVYSVFRYPFNEHKLTCSLTWTVVAQEDTAIVKEHTGPPAVLWHTKEELSEVATSHKAYRRYGIQAVSFSKKKLQTQLSNQLQKVMKQRFKAWLSQARQQELIRKGLLLVSRFKNELSLELLAFLSYVSPADFLDRFQQRLSIEFNDPVPYLIP